MKFRHICMAAMIARGGLKTAHEALEGSNDKLPFRLVLLRSIILEISNIADLAEQSGSLYKDDRRLGELHKQAKDGMDFAKYLRNKYVGHLVSGLADKTFEWQPYANKLVGSTDEQSATAISWFALETAINTYVTENDEHKVFDTETDLNYPPDQTRFLNFLGDTALRTLAYADELIAVSRDQFSVPDVEKDMLELAMKAGKTDFAYLRKGKR